MCCIRITMFACNLRSKSRVDPDRSFQPGEDLNHPLEEQTKKRSLRSPSRADVTGSERNRSRHALHPGVIDLDICI